MSIKKKLIIHSAAISIVPMVLVAIMVFWDSKAALLESLETRLNVVADLKKSKVEIFFDNLRDDMVVTRGSYSIRKNLPILTRYLNDKKSAEYLDATALLDAQLTAWLTVKTELSDIMLLNPDGQIVYSANPEHAMGELGRHLPTLGDAPLAEAKKGVYLSDVYRVEDPVIEYRYGLLGIAPISGLDNAFSGFVVFEVNMKSVFQFLQDSTGMGETGETLLVRREGDNALFLHPLRDDQDAALNRKVPFSQIAHLPVQRSLEGKNGSGNMLDYRGREVLAAWRFIPSMGWGLVLKMDMHEVLAPARELRLFVFLICCAICVLSGVLSLSLANSIALPIRHLRSQTDIIGSGDLDRHVEMDRSDEIGDLSRDFDAMRLKLRELYSQLEKKVKEKTKAYEESEESKRAAFSLMSELQNFNIALRAREAELARSNNELDEFAYVVSHDLKAPLRGIASLSTWLQADYGEKLGDEGRVQLELIRDRVFAMDNLINGILEYSRISRGQDVEEAVELDGLVRDTLDLSDIPPNITVAVGPLPVVYCRPVRVRQIFQNLIGNAVTFMDKEKGVIDIKCREEDAHWVFCVEDNGPGIEERHFERIFKLFQYLPVAGKMHGSGVGLSLVKKAVEAHGGRVWLESQVGLGSKFFFTMPKLIVFGGPS